MSDSTQKSGISSGSDTKPGRLPLRNEEDPRIEVPKSVPAIDLGPGRSPQPMDEAERGTGR
jgi:hypothetical protein